MKKIAVAFFIIFMMAGTSYALNPIDSLLGKRVFLNTIHRTVLVNRLTGEVNYLLSTDKKTWIPLSGSIQGHYQGYYDAQLKLLNQ